MKYIEVISEAGSADTISALRINMKHLIFALMRLVMTVSKPCVCLLVTIIFSLYSRHGKHYLVHRQTPALSSYLSRLIYPGPLTRRADKKTRPPPHVEHFIMMSNELLFSIRVSLFPLFIPFLPKSLV